MSKRPSTLTKFDLSQQVFDKIGFSKKEAARFVDGVFAELKKAFLRGETVKIHGFGNFVVKKKKTRLGRNPQTGEQITIKARRMLSFRSGQTLKALLNDKSK